MAMKSRKGRIYVDPEFKKFLLIKKAESGEPTLASFTSKAARNPSLLNTEKEIKSYKKRGNYYEPLF